MDLVLGFNGFWGSILNPQPLSLPNLVAIAVDSSVAKGAMASAV